MKPVFDPLLGQIKNDESDDAIFIAKETREALNKSLEQIDEFVTNYDPNDVCLPLTEVEILAMLEDDDD